MKVLLKDEYFTGNYAIVGDIEGGIEVKELPPMEDSKKILAYKLENEEWIFDEEKYQEILNKETEEEKQQKIVELQAKLNETDYKIIKCSECQLIGEELPYDITLLHKERQAIRDEINKLQESED